jgi:sterol desaturase/sphingolipid hydroxylase (fatty acid hydroxylase superfamily)
MLSDILAFFEHIPSWQRACIIAGGIFFFWVLEGFIPFKQMLYNKARHGVLNIVFTVTTILVNVALAFALLAASDWATQQNFGVFHWLQAPLWVKVILALMVMDLVGAYLIHFLEHKIKLMWRFHLVHHTDTNIDATTANRHHPGESFFRAIFTALGILVAGAPFGVVMLYQSMSVALSQFNHANIHLPEWLDKLISYLVVSPNMHKVHHHYVLPYTDTNYGNIFSIWDRLFGTFATMQKDDLVYGVDTHMHPKEHEDFKNLMAIPFQQYRKPTGSKFEEKI